VDQTIIQIQVQTLVDILNHVLLVDQTTIHLFVQTTGLRLITILMDTRQFAT
jgi:hypothetical protein